MAKTPINPDQLVFPFMREDPTYQADLRRAQIGRDVERSIRKKLTEQLTQVAISTCFHFVESTVERAVEKAVNRAVAPLQAELQNLIKSLRRPSQDEAADWWKEGRQDEEASDRDDELPF